MKLKLKKRERCSEVGFDESTQLTAIFHGTDHEANARIFMAAKELFNELSIDPVSSKSRMEILKMVNEFQEILKDKNDPEKNKRGGGR